MRVVQSVRSKVILTVVAIATASAVSSLPAQASPTIASIIVTPISNDSYSEPGISVQGEDGKVYTITYKLDPNGLVSGLRFRGQPIVDVQSEVANMVSKLQLEISKNTKMTPDEIAFLLSPEIAAIQKKLGVEDQSPTPKTASELSDKQYNQVVAIGKTGARLVGAAKDAATQLAIRKATSGKNIIAKGTYYAAAILATSVIVAQVATLTIMPMIAGGSFHEFLSPLWLVVKWDTSVYLGTVWVREMLRKLNPDLETASKGFERPYEFVKAEAKSCYLLMKNTAKQKFKMGSGN